MVAMSLLLFVFRARDHRGLDGDLRAEDDRRRTRRAATQWRTPSQRLSWLARNGRSPGEESRCDGVAAQTIEAQPVRGQIEPSQRPGASRAEPQVREKMAGLGSNGQEVDTVRRRKRNERRQTRWSPARSQPQATGSRATSMCTRRDRRFPIECSEEGRHYLAQARSFDFYTFSQAVEEPDGAGSFLMRCGCENWLRTAPDCRARIERAGSVKMVNRVHAVPPMKTAPRQAKTWC